MNTTDWNRKTDMQNKSKINFDELLQDALDETAKEAADWAVRLTQDDFDKVIVLMYKQYKTFVERMQQGIDEFSRTNLENDSLVYCLDYLKGYLTEALMKDKEELTNA